MDSASDVETCNEYLVVYNYGQGGLWAYVKASEPDMIQRRYPTLQVVGRPSWLTDVEAVRLERFQLDYPTGWLATLERSES